MWSRTDSAVATHQSRIEAVLRSLANDVSKWRRIAFFIPCGVSLTKNGQEFASEQILFSEFDLVEALFLSILGNEIKKRPEYRAGLLHYKHLLKEGAGGFFAVSAESTCFLGGNRQEWAFYKYQLHCSHRSMDRTTVSGTVDRGSTPRGSVVDVGGLPRAFWGL